MTDLSRSTAHRIISPEVAALCLAALRLGLQVSKSSVSLDLVEGKWENYKGPSTSENSGEAESSLTSGGSNAQTKR